MRGSLAMALSAALVASAAASGPAWARTVIPPLGAPHVEISQVEFGVDGDPFLVANFAPDGRLARPVWWRCEPRHACRRLRSGNPLRAGTTPPGTVFEARAAYRGVTYVARTPSWTGRVRWLTRPRLLGVAAVGRRVRAVPGTWTGGWARQAVEDVMRVEACPGPSPSGCVTLSVRGREFPGLGAPPLIRAAQRGWYLFAVDQRLPRDRPMLLIRYG